MSTLSLDRILPSLIAAAAAELSRTGDPHACALAGQMRAAELAPAAEALAAAQSSAALEHLPGAVRRMPRRALARLLRACAAALPWTAGEIELPASIRGRNAFVELLGPAGPVPSEALKAGFYFQSPACRYPPHNHAADELYLILSGSAGWQVDDGAWFALLPGDIIRHRPWQRHAMSTGPEPLLALWTWTGDLRASTYRIDPD